MIDQKIYQLWLDKFNDKTINTQAVSFNGNHVFVRVNDNLTVATTSTYNPYDTVDKYVVVVGETVSLPTDYIDENNRTGWNKQLTFRFDVRQKDKVLEAMQQVYLYFKANTVQSIVDDTTYKMIVKMSRPAFAGTEQGAGTVFVYYTMNIDADMLETGWFGNEAVHTMGISSGALTSIILDELIIGSAVAVNPSNKLTVEENTDNKAISRGITYQFTIDYDGTTLNEKLRKVIEGIDSRETKFYYRKVFNSQTENHTFLITGGSVVYKKGVMIQLKFSGVQTS